MLGSVKFISSPLSASAYSLYAELEVVSYDMQESEAVDVYDLQTANGAWYLFGYVLL